MQFFFDVHKTILDIIQKRNEEKTKRDSERFR